MDNSTFEGSENDVNSTNNQLKNSFRFSADQILFLVKLRIEMDKSHFSNINYKTKECWEVLAAKLNIGADGPLCQKRWANCLLSYKKWKNPPTGVGNESQARQKKPIEWVQALDKWFSCKDTHNPPFVIDTASESVIIRSQQASNKDNPNIVSVSDDEVEELSTSLEGSSSSNTPVKKRRISHKARIEERYLEALERGFEDAAKSTQASIKLADSIGLLVQYLTEAQKEKIRLPIVENGSQSFSSSYHYSEPEDHIPDLYADQTH